MANVFENFPPIDPRTVLITQQERQAAVAEKWPAQKRLNYDEVVDLLNQVRVNHFPMIQSYRALVYQEVVYGQGGLLIQQQATMRVLDRDKWTDLSTLTFTGNDPVSYEACTRERILEQIVRPFLVKIITHELDECLLVAGARLFDPHKNDPPPVTYVATWEER